MIQLLALTFFFFYPHFLFLSLLILILTGKCTKSYFGLSLSEHCHHCCCKQRQVKTEDAEDGASDPFCLSCLKVFRRRADTIGCTAKGKNSLHKYS